MAKKERANKFIKMPNGKLVNIMQDQLFKGKDVEKSKEKDTKRRTIITDSSVEEVKKIRPDGTEYYVEDTVFRQLDIVRKESQGGVNMTQVATKFIGFDRLTSKNSNLVKLFNFILSKAMQENIDYATGYIKTHKAWNDRGTVDVYENKMEIKVSELLNAGVYQGDRKVMYRNLRNDADALMYFGVNVTEKYFECKRKNSIPQQLTSITMTTLFPTIRVDCNKNDKPTKLTVSLNGEAPWSKIVERQYIFPSYFLDFAGTTYQFAQYICKHARTNKKYDFNLSIKDVLEKLDITPDTTNRNGVKVKEELENIINNIRDAQYRIYDENYTQDIELSIIDTDTTGIKFDSIAQLLKKGSINVKLHGELKEKIKEIASKKDKALKEKEKERIRKEKQRKEMFNF